MEKISVTIICYNEERNIVECINSVLWADEIILIDSFSEDKTIEIANNYNIKIFQHKWEGFAKQREFALTKCSYDWVLSIDSDERCTSELANEIKEIINSKTTITGFRIPRKNFFLGKWIKHCGWYPGYQLRLFNKNKVKVADRLVHEKYETDTEPGLIKSNILHFTVQSINDYATRVNHYSSLQAIEKLNRKQIGFLDVFLRPVLAVLHHYILKGGFLDGIRGLMVVQFHVITNMLTYMKIWEMQNKKIK